MIGSAAFAEGAHLIEPELASFRRIDAAALETPFILHDPGKTVGPADIPRHLEGSPFEMPQYDFDLACSGAFDLISALDLLVNGYMVSAVVYDTKTVVALLDCSNGSYPQVFSIGLTGCSLINFVHGMHCGLQFELQSDFCNMALRRFISLS